MTLTRLNSVTTLSRFRWQSMLLGTLLTLTLAACSSSPYRAADGRGIGYSEHLLSDDQYRIHFRAVDESVETATDYALLRASELTLLNSYDWFDLASLNSQASQQEVEVILEIRMGKGIRPDSQISYDARDLYQRLQQDR